MGGRRGDEGSGKGGYGGWGGGRAAGLEVGTRGGGAFPNGASAPSVD